MSETLPDQTETDSSMTFIAAKPATARHLISHRACAPRRFRRAPARTDARVADPLHGLDHRRRVELVFAPIDGETPRCEIQPGIDDAGKLLQPALDLADAAGAADAFHRQRHMGGAGVAWLTNIDRSEASAIAATHRKTIRFSGTEQPLAMAGQLDHQVPLA